MANIDYYILNCSIIFSQIWNQAIFITGNHAPFHLCQKKILLKRWKVLKYYDHGCRFRNGTDGPWGFFLRKYISF